jgi:hypothetical protein
MAGQTSVSNAPNAALQAGQVADLCPLNDVMSYVSAEASAEIPFGRMLVQGTGDKDAKLMAAQADAMIGISVFSQAYNRDNEIGATGVKPKMTLGVMTRGRIWVQVTADVTPASVVRVHKTGGTFQDDSSAGNTVVLKNARYLTTTLANGLALLEFDILGRSSNTND